jgi:hypothetical protein
MVNECNGDITSIDVRLSDARVAGSPMIGLEVVERALTQSPGMFSHIESCSSENTHSGQSMSVMRIFHQLTLLNDCNTAGGFIL